MTDAERKIYAVAWYAKNRERLKQQRELRKTAIPPYQPRTRLTDKEKKEAKKAYNKTYYKVNGERLNAKRRGCRAPRKQPYIRVGNSTPAYRERQKRKRARWAERNPDKHKERGRKAQVRRQFAGVVDVEIKKLLVETKLLQLNIKKLLNRGETNEKRR
jgi:hypothetical protein